MAENKLILDYILDHAVNKKDAIFLTQPLGAGKVANYTWGQTVDALVKMQTLEVPREELWSRLPNTAPQDVARWRAMRVTDDLLAPVVPVLPNAG